MLANDSVWQTFVLLLLRSSITRFILLRHGSGWAILAMLMALLASTTSGCATTGGVGYVEANTCDPSKFEPGQPECLSAPGYFCSRSKSVSQQAENGKPDARYLATGFTLFPSKEAIGPALPVCPPNATRLVQDQDWKDARNGARHIGHRVGWVLAICDNLVEGLARQPDHVLAGRNQIQPEELEEKFTRCASELDSLPAIPAYEDPWLAGAAAQGFIDGYGEGADEVWRRIILIELAVAAVEVAITAGVGLAEVVMTRGLRASLNVVRRMPIFIPGAVGSGGAFLKSAPRAAANAVVKGSSRRLGRHLIRSGKTRLPGEFAHHIAAHGDPRAAKSVEILEGFGIHVDNEVNGVFLPGYESSPNPKGKVVHGNMHTNAYHMAVESMLNTAETPADAMRILQNIASNLEKGKMP